MSVVSQGLKVAISSTLRPTDYVEAVVSYVPISDYTYKLVHKMSMDKTTYDDATESGTLDALAAGLKTATDALIDAQFNAAATVTHYTTLNNIVLSSSTTYANSSFFKSTPTYYYCTLTTYIKIA